MPPLLVAVSVMTCCPAGRFFATKICPVPILPERSDVQTSVGQLTVLQILDNRVKNDFGP